ncbi:ABA4-like family protein [Aurantiacibacter poecillastricola]|uniref:ABA4-like family protein n=1 Tax=Aurantiacibacter poecillastricola TaxID=3064385 RepID=UPI00273F7380|nr:ABA4-like family protein [Aurantiacibacter sp. 219JJ12-13]MDP5262580.1 ABA4-like family protein [Aurantiacibacter sp. 219JJ12-13]
MWDSLFGIANVWAMVCWAALIVLPRTKLLQSAVFYAGIGLFCLAYVVLLVLLLTGSLNGRAVEGASDPSFQTIEGVRGIFMSDGGVTVGWIHYLAFDLFAGLWIAKDADQKGFSRWLQAPVLLITFVAGPAGLLAWLAIRERRARRNARVKR